MTDLSTDLIATVERIAKKATRIRPHLYDDAVQEGLTAAWLLPATSTKGLQVRVAQRAVLDVTRGRPSITSTGGTSRYEPTSALSIDALVDTDSEAEGCTFVPPTRDHSADVIRRVDLDRAIRSLPIKEDRAIAWTFLRSGSLTEAARDLQLKPNTVRARWARSIAPSLRGALA